MKELSIEEKAEAYDKALKKTKELVSCGLIYEDAAIQIFPGLKESEDEKIRKEIIEYIKTGTYHKDWIAWLEKQGEQKSYASETMNEKADFDNGFTRMMEKEQKPTKIEPKFKVGQTIKKEGFNLGFTIAKIEDDFYYNDMGDYFPFTDQDNWELVKQKTTDKVELKFKVGDKVHLINGSSPNYEDDCIVIGDISNNTYYGNWEGGYFAIKDQDKYELVEQKPVEWNEEDSKRLHRITDFLWYNRKGDTDTIYQQEQDIDWLKSLHPQRRWKPNGDQLDALYDMIRSFKKESSYTNRDDIANVVDELLEQLKAL